MSCIYAFMHVCIVSLPGHITVEGDAHRVRHPDNRQCWNGTCSKRLVFSMPRMWIANYAATRVKQFHTRPTYRPGRSVDGFYVLDPHPRLRFSQYPSLDPRPYYPQAARANCTELLGFASPTPHGRYTKYRFVTVLGPLGCSYGDPGSLDPAKYG